MSSSTPLPRRRLGRTRAATALAAAGALIMSAGVIGLIASPASANHEPGHTPPGQVDNPGQGNPSPGGPSTPPGQTNHKSYVCKYVSIPGQAERLQTGQNPIWVDNHAIPGYNGGPVVNGAVFTDGQEKSVVIRANSPRLSPEPTVADCPSSGGGQSTVPTLIQTGAGCPNINGSLSLPSVPAGVSFAVQTLSGGDTTAPYGPGTYRVTVTTTGDPFPNGLKTYTYPDVTVAAGTPPPCSPTGGLEDVMPAVAFTDADCDNLGEEDWDGTLEAILDYEESGDVGPGETVTVKAMIEPGLTGTYEFAPGAQTTFSHTFDDVTLADCVQGEETVVPKPKPEPKPDKEPTVKGVEVVVPPAAPPAAAPTAVAAGIGDTAASPLQTIAQTLVAGGMLLLMAGAWIGLGRRESGTHEA